MEGFLDLRALEGRGRIVIVREAQRMNVAAQNALLKTLEEPRPGTVLVLEAHKSDRLLPTIKSRCVRIRFEPLDVADCVQVLERNGLAGAGSRPQVTCWCASLIYVSASPMRFALETMAISSFISLRWCAC